MSSFIVEAEHISEIIKHYEDLPNVTKYFYNDSDKKEIKLPATLKTDEALGVVLGCANLKSYNARYPQYKIADDVEDKKWLEDILYDVKKPKDSKLTYAELINMCSCLNYQSMDYKFYDHTDAKYILSTIKKSFVHQWANEETEADDKISWSYPN